MLSRWIDRPAVAIGLFFLAAVVATAAARACAAEEPPPNILFIFTDDLTCQALSTYDENRHLLATPNIDRLAREGMRFDRCLVTNSICGPSRATILTGKYSHKNGFYNNANCRFDPDQPTFPKMLQASGWQTALIGKWHLVSEPAGFDHWEILPGQGIYYNPPMITAAGTAVRRGYVTDVITDLSLEWLAGRDRRKPFLLMCQHKAPHREWSPAIRHLGWDGDRPHPEPDTLFDDFAGRSRAVADHDMGLDRTFTALDAKFVAPPGIDGTDLVAWNAHYTPRNEAFRTAQPSGRDLIRWRYNRYMHDYLACVKAIDESVGRLLDELDRQQIADETVVVLSSDQGFFLGEHGWFDKRWIFEESLRTPLIVRWPGVTRPDSHCERIVSLIDFAPTFLTLAGLSTPADMQGHALQPLLAEHATAPWRTSLYYHYYEFPEPHRVRPHRGVITDRHKLVHYEGDLDEWELLDRKVDPAETRSFHDDPAYAGTLRELRAEFDRLIAEVDDRGPVPREAYGDAPLPGMPLGGSEGE
jgi:arylsulfatase A-like enzyme